MVGFTVLKESSQAHSPEAKVTSIFIPSGKS